VQNISAGVYATGWAVEKHGFDSRKGKNIFLYSFSPVMTRFSADKTVQTDIGAHTMGIGVKVARA
jgi:hypothetical protein